MILITSNLSFIIESTIVAKILGQADRLKALYKICYSMYFLACLKLIWPDFINSIISLLVTWYIMKK